MSDEHIRRKALKITFLGDSAVGKTCICNRILKLDFREGSLATIGKDKMVCKMKMRDGKEMKIVLWDTAGQERFFAIAVNTVKNAQGILIVFDVGKRSSFENVNMWLEQIRLNSEIVPVVLFGNKCDIDKEKRVVSKEEAEKLADKLNMKYFETSAKDNIGIDEGFEEIINLAYDTFKYSTGKDLNDVNSKEKGGCCLTKGTDSNKKKSKK